MTNVDLSFHIILNLMYYAVVSGASLNLTSTLPSFNEILKYNYNNQVLVREIRLSPRCKLYLIPSGI